jgi:tritrans,polycis-undecaprenyl-diphosphate synthase [geranylgeranyl-diphosphate specific]
VTARSGLEGLYEGVLGWQIRHVPRHIAIIQDGNRRFARAQGLDVGEGHRLGADTTERVLDWAADMGVRYITLYSFSTENFRRDSAEVESLFALFKERFEKILSDERIHRRRIRVRVFGDRALLPPDLLERVEAAEAATRSYGEYFMNIALAYGGRNEIVHAARAILGEVREGALTPGMIDPALVERHLSSGRYLPPVDLIIRTGAERRTSNFLPWLANGKESAVYFCAPNWPGFRRLDFLRALRVYDQRMRSKA